MNTIVVGVDGSRSSLAALRHAIREARLRGDRLKLVTVWHLPAVAYGNAFAAPTLDSHDFESAAEAILERALEDVGAEAADVQIDCVVREGDAGHVLLEEAAGAESLIVGCHDYRFVRRLFHHSVSGECAHEARCPVTVVHES